MYCTAVLPQRSLHYKMLDDNEMEDFATRWLPACMLFDDDDTPTSAMASIQALVISAALQQKAANAPPLDLTAAWRMQKMRLLSDWEPPAAEDEFGGADMRCSAELGCGWGSVSLWFAETFPNIEVVGFIYASHTYV